MSDILEDSAVNREIAALGAQKWAESLRSSMALNGAGAGLVVTLVAGDVPNAIWFHLAALPFVAGLLFGLVASLFTFTSPLEPISTKFEDAERVGKATLVCACLFVLGVILTFSMSLAGAIES